MRKNYQLLNAAATRYQVRTPERNAKLKRIKEEGIEAVEDATRVRTRKELLGNGFNLGLEQMMRANDLLNISYLEAGLQAAHAVCRIQVFNDRGSLSSYGTGLMVSPNLLLTNNHVLSSIDAARHSLADFNYERDLSQALRAAKTFLLEPERFFYTNAELDFTLVAVNQSATDGAALAAFGYLHLIADSGKALLGESLSIIQHPHGDTKQIALRENHLLDVFDQFVQYETDTLPGSSGSPVFNDQWQVVALHHAGVPKRDAKGQILTVGNTPWKPQMGKEQIAWVANEGIRISSILQHLRRKTRWTPAQKTLLNELIR